MFLVRGHTRGVGRRIAVRIVVGHEGVLDPRIYRKKTIFLVGVELTRWRMSASVYSEHWII